LIRKLSNCKESEPLKGREKMGERKGTRQGQRKTIP
jgi:hypothetical protein